MPRDLVIGNGSLLVAYDAQYRLADFYFPHVGMENQAGSPFRFGVWADGALSWIEDAAWKKSLLYLRDTLITDVTCENPDAGLRLRCHDAVDADANVFLRKIVVRNLRDERREVKLFIHHDFNLYGSPINDTAMFDPRVGAMIHYKANRYVLINAQVGDAIGLTEYTCGRSGIGAVEGTWRDAEDGALAMTPIAQGAVDSTIALPVTVGPHGSTTVLYWICTGRRYGEVCKLDEGVRQETPSRVLSRTASYWYTWVNKTGESLIDLPDEIAELYRRSILTVTTQCDNNGAVTAANDSDILWAHDDHYSYVWTRDAAFVCDAMGRAGFPEISRRFLLFARDLIKEEGYFLHKYNPDGSLASLWHPWLRDGKPQLPIQEDETAVVVWLVARHYERTRDLELLRAVYKRLVVQPAEFLVSFRDPRTHLPLPSFDLWEERQGIFTYTCCAVVGALEAAATLANIFNDQERRDRYTAAAGEIREAVVRHLWLDAEQRFARGLVLRGDDFALDKSVDASLFGTFYFGAFAPGSAMVEGSVRAIREHLALATEVGGIARYAGDAYQRRPGDGEETDIPGNPWLICTLWMAEHSIASATNIGELQTALDLLWWARAKATPSLLLPEQLSPRDGRPLSVAPLTWSHAQVISVTRGYLDTLERLRRTNSELGARDGKRGDVDKL